MGEFSETDINSTEAARKLDAFEGVVQGHLQAPPVEEIRSSLDREVEEFNGWFEGGKTDLESARVGLEAQIGRVREMEAQLSALDRELEGMTPDVTDAGSVAAYNSRVERRNSIVAEHRALAATCASANEGFNERIQAFNREAENRSADIKARQDGLEQRVRSWQSFVDEGRPRELNALFAAACVALRQGGAGASLWAAVKDRCVALREILGEHFERAHEAGQRGLQIVRVELGDGVTGRFVVDTGASVTALSPELARALGIDTRGGKATLSLPAAIRIEVPKVCLPRIGVHGEVAEHVKGVVLEESSPGLDGILGLSFLTRFEFTITLDGLQLTPRPVAEEPRYDVFICHKTADLEVCKRIYEVLTAAGKRVFLDAISLTQQANNEYQVVIDEVLEDVRHLVVVLSDGEQSASPWVASEWRTFKGLKQSGKKQGNLVPFLCGDMTPEELPASLHLYQAVSIHDEEWERKLLNFLR